MDDFRYDPLYLVIDRSTLLCERLAVVHFDSSFVLVIDFDCSYRGVLLFWILQKKL